MNQTSFDFVVIGGGMSGLCAAISAARKGIKTALIHARPMLGGNASSEIRMHICGADYHMSRPNARETGIVEEILLDHKKYNPTNNYAIFDSVLWEKATFCDNLTLFLNTCVDEVKVENGQIVSVTTYQQTTEKRIVFEAPLFADATGDGTIGAWAGADYVVGREGKETYGETYAPDKADHYTMGSSLMFKARDVGQPVPFIKPKWANTYTEHDLRKRIHEDITSGYWWIELGGDKYNTIDDAEIIRDELLKAIYGVWDHIKNGGDHRAQNMELEWVGMLPGKRESRRLLGDYVLCERDCVEGKRFEDAVAYGGWPMDIHTVEGFLNNSEDPTQWIELDDVYTIPYRCYYSHNISNLFICGRIISASHMAFASARVMATCAIGGQAVGTAAAIAVKKHVFPRDVGLHMFELQQSLLKDDCYIPGVINLDPADLIRTAQITATIFIEGCGPENINNGIARTVGNDMNCWAAYQKYNPILTCQLNQTENIRSISITFDSNLSREITISINKDVLNRQVIGSPPELVRKCQIILEQNGQRVTKIEIDNNSQRHCVINLKSPVSCDTIRLEEMQTYGSPIIRIFEIRAYT
ncbi:MAG: FAD-dependent oxidoreductase [Eubacteriales bacterium]|nr:FAD-dependent oxidoreductase [Eubacteriales bacterium]